MTGLVPVIQFLPPRHLRGQGRRLRQKACPALGPHPCPASLLSVKASGPAEGRLHWLLTRYAGTRLAAGEALTQREDRLLLCGTEVPIVAPRGADGASAAPRQRIAAALATQFVFGDGKRALALSAAVRRILAALPGDETTPGELARR